MSVHEAGLQAVARVRSVRESDSRIGLQTALAELRAIGTKVAAIRVRIEHTAAFEVGSAGTFLALRQTLEALGEALIAAEAERAQAVTISDAALAQWHYDRSRLDAIEMLIERRAAARRAERTRREARDLDDIAAQRWLRAQEAVA